MPMGKVLEWIRETYVVQSNFVKFATLQPQLTQLQSQPSYKIAQLQSQPSYT